MSVVTWTKLRGRAALRNAFSFAKACPAHGERGRDLVGIATVIPRPHDAGSQIH